MKRPLTESELEKISAHITTHMGLQFPPSSWRNLERILRTAAANLGFSNVQECIAQFTSTPPAKEFIASLASYLTTGETYFLREIRCFEILEKQIIPEIIKKRRGKDQQLRIWSAGCATGEEVYSIAILLDKMRDTLQNWKISILATDINPVALSKAEEGIYTKWSFRTTPPDFRTNYFQETENGLFALLPKIKEMVTFSNLNLVADSYSSLVTDNNAIDVIFCRNVLMYFPPHITEMVVDRFHSCLQDDGYVFVSPCETTNAFFTGLAQIHFHDVTFYQKKGNGDAVKPTKITPASPFEPESTVSPPPPDSEGHTETSAYQEAVTFYEQGNYKEATARIFSQLTQDKNDTRSLLLLCRIYANEGSLSEALTISDRVLATNILSAELHYLRAMIFLEQGQDAESAVSLKKALYLEPDMVMAHFTLANLEHRQGNHRESQSHFNQALSLLDRYHQDKVIKESDGMLAGRIKEIIRVTTART